MFVHVRIYSCSINKNFQPQNKEILNQHINRKFKSQLTKEITKIKNYD